MVSTKVVLTSYLPGAIMLSEKVCESDPNNSYESHSFCTEKSVKKGKKIFTNKVWVKYKTRKCQDVAQVTNICDEAYKYMISSECPEWARIGDWKKMSVTQRLVAHLDRTCKSLGGKYFKYEIMPD